MMNARLRNNSLRLTTILLLVFVMLPIAPLPASAQPIEDFEDPTQTFTPAQKADLNERLKANEIAKLSTPTAELRSGCSKDYVTCGILFALNWLMDMVISIVYPLVEQVFTALLSENLTAFGNGRVLVAAEVGWRIILGIVNMFFILLLLWMAIATIFDFSMFSARNLLPRLIIAALLINFSFAIGKSIINLSNGIGAVFYQQILQGGGPATVVKRMFDVKTMTLAVQQQYVSLSPEEAKQKLTNAKFTLQRGITPFGIINIPLGFKTEWNALECYQEVYKPRGAILGSVVYLSNQFVLQEWVYNQCNALLKNVEISQALAAIDPTYGSETLLAGVFIVKAFMIPIVLFVLFAGSIFFLVRLISLMGLLIFAPFAFLAFIVPAMGHFWTGWWQRLFKWSFFLPAFLFLFMLSFLVIDNIPLETYRAILAGKAVPNFSRLMLDYAIGVGLMIFALLMGNQMSVWGAAAVTGWGKKMSRGVERWTANRGWKYAGRATGAAMGTRGGAALARIPVLGAGVRAGAAALIKKGAGVEKKDTEFYTKLSNRELARQFGSRAIPPHLRQTIYRSFNNRRQREFAAEARRQGIDLQALVGTATWRQRTFPRIFGQPPQVIAAPPQAAAVTQAQLQQIQNQTLQVQVIQNLQNILRQLPPQLQTAVTQGIQQSLQTLPRGAQSAAVTRTVNQAIQNSIQVQTPANQILMQGALQSQNAQAQIQTAVTQATQAAQQAIRQAEQQARAAAQTPSELQEEVEELRNRLEEVEERPSGGGNA